VFDIGFSELLVVFVVALIILGPERLPTAAKTAGLWIRKIRRSISSVQREINAQLDQEELQQNIAQTNQRIMKEGNDIQNRITPLPESAPVDKPDEPIQEADLVTPNETVLEVSDKNDAAIQPVTPTGDSTEKTTKSDTNTTETSRS